RRRDECRQRIGRAFDGGLLDLLRLGGRLSIRGEDSWRERRRRRDLEKVLAGDLHATHYRRMSARASAGVLGVELLVLLAIATPCSAGRKLSTSALFACNADL